MSEIKNDQEDESLEDRSSTNKVLKNMQKQLAVMEEKLDALIKQTKPRPYKDKGFSKPYTKYGDSSRPRARKYERKTQSTSDAKFYNGSPFSKGKANTQSSFNKPNKPYMKPNKKKTS